MMPQILPFDFSQVSDSALLHTVISSSSFLLSDLIMFDHFIRRLSYGMRRSDIVHSCTEACGMYLVKKRLEGEQSIIRNTCHPYMTNRDSSLHGRGMKLIQKKKKKKRLAMGLFIGAQRNDVFLGSIFHISLFLDDFSVLYVLFPCEYTSNILYF